MKQTRYIWSYVPRNNENFANPLKLISTNKNDSKVTAIYLSSLHSPLLPFYRHGRKFLHYWGSSSKGHTPENINRAFQTCHWIDCYIFTFIRSPINLFHKKTDLLILVQSLHSQSDGLLGFLVGPTGKHLLLFLLQIYNTKWFLPPHQKLPLPTKTISALYHYRYMCHKM